MIRLIQVLIGWLIATSGISAGEPRWEVLPTHADKSVVILKLSSESTAKDLETALEDLESGQTLKHVVLSQFSRYQSVEDEIVGYLARNHPAALAEAKGSAGNIGNPALRPIERVFPEAVLATQLVQGVRGQLRTHGYEILGVDFEKLSLIRDGKDLRFLAFVWLTIRSVEVDNEA